MKIKTILLAFLLTSCAGNIEKFKDSDFASTKNYQERITNIIKRSSKNPDSVVIKKMSQPKKTLIQNMNPSALWNPYFPVQGVCVEYFGANPYGLTTFKKLNFYITNDKIIAEATTQRQYEPCLIN